MNRLEDIGILSHRISNDRAIAIEVDKDITVKDGRDFSISELIRWMTTLFCIQIQCI